MYCRKEFIFCKSGKRKLFLILNEDDENVDIGKKNRDNRKMSHPNPVA